MAILDAMAEYDPDGALRQLILDAIAAIEVGRDVAPAQRFRIEALLERALNTDGVDRHRLLSLMVAALPEWVTIEVTEDDPGVSDPGATNSSTTNPSTANPRAIDGIDSRPKCRVSVDLWQQRAPVVPSTSD